MLPFAIYDVFSDRAYAGNQLAVVFDGQDLTTAQMQAIALEFNFSETVFVLPAAAPGADYLARIFTPAEELPFAGHPTIGAAIAAVASGRVASKSGTVVQECGAGLMTVAVAEGTAKLTSTTISVGPELDPALAAAAIGLDAAKIIGTPKNASAGLDHNFVRLADADVPDAVDVPGHLEKVYLFSFDENTRAVHARLFHRGVGEDPATGSAAVALGVHLVDQGLISGDGVHSYEIAQGAEIDRPSTLHGEVVVENGAAVSVSVSGAAVKVAEGTLLTLPE
ncbi:PhzF family phenazine biosynthesis protein [Glycomyces algeriensis]|uniref:Phenazine biosynthesis protein PhzF n=1 Tax=Glycomyces algeriensis TaxID=256037 RepID=A0A9W6GEA1_9ACTN|nr:PhzF family phenazine biosynthesis protein [Glycomyces algeriensis]MDA1369009.1 PhzF family phenazine biosynthesis protein [Glycomyces algeriensis]MDR7352318.1 trans-2,3-dihydro-3-hydroxyanthranilate isomerase [Glycomyces algeriensis]GLI45053.1 phenazine biosynthesis protein PhzF [Glycomyces algeriensis]